MGPFRQGLYKQSWWKASSEGYRDLDVEERFLDSPPESRGSTEEAPEKAPTAQLESSRRLMSSSRIYWATFLNALLLVSTILVASFGGLFPWTADQTTCVKATSYYSPILESKPMPLHSVQLNGSLWPGESPSWSRLEPGAPETESMWDTFELAEKFPITRADVVALGKDPETVARFPDAEYGLGEDAYIASLDVQHKLHCLNALRKMTFTDYGDTTPVKKQHGQLWWIHLRHCVDMLTQDMICHADADLITYQWIDTQPNPFPDFSINRQCRNLDDVISFKDQRKVDLETYVTIAKPEGVKQVPFEPEYYAAYGFADSDLFPNGEGYGPVPKYEFFGLPPTED